MTMTMKQLKRQMEADYALTSMGVLCKPPGWPEKDRYSGVMDRIRENQSLTAQQVLARRWEEIRLEDFGMASDAIKEELAKTDWSTVSPTVRNLQEGPAVVGLVAEPAAIRK